jgi:hypothetical protein
LPRSKIVAAIKDQEKLEGKDYNDQKGVLASDGKRGSCAASAEPDLKPD